MIFGKKLEVARELSRAIGALAAGPSLALLNIQSSDSFSITNNTFDSKPFRDLLSDPAVLLHTYREQLRAIQDLSATLRAALAKGNHHG